VPEHITKLLKGKPEEDVREDTQSTVQERPCPLAQFVKTSGESIIRIELAYPLGAQPFDVPESLQAQASLSQFVLRAIEILIEDR
jgi:hypothetical protein